jgi:2-polyprenyl-3-methyl-5-hydroxy-6-metoxy-1,4-benzoquinol methylase
MKYRDIIYAKYRTTFYGLHNPSEYTNAKSNYDIDFKALLPDNYEVNILDIGCGMGHFLYYLKEKGFISVKGIDISPEQVEFCKQNNLNVSLVTNTIEYLMDNLNSFDVIIINDVIEHLNKGEIVEILEAIFKSLKENGNLIIRTGNMAAIYGAYARYIDFTHEIGFTETSLYQILSSIGFRNIEIKGNKVPFGVKPKRLIRWMFFNIWRQINHFILLIELGMAKPKILDKFLIAIAIK